jgi:hypothetical protein
MFKGGIMKSINCFLKDNGTPNRMQIYTYAYNDRWISVGSVWQYPYVATVSIDLLLYIIAIGDHIKINMTCTV